MPTATTASQFALTNWGPLTTAFTADAACTATPGIVQLGVTDSPGNFIGAPDCNVPTLGSCFPSASKVDARASSAFTEVDKFVIGYFSPGIVCPSGWSTAGIVVKSSDGSVSTSGIYQAPPEFTATTSGRDAGINRPIFNPIVNVFTAAIDPGETGMACCPSSMTAHISGYCFSTLPDYKVSTACDRFLPDNDLSTTTGPVTLFGVTTTAALLTFANDAPISTTRTRTFTGSTASTILGYSVIPQVTLVHRAQDVSAGGGGGGGGSPPNAAGPGRVRAADTGAQWAFVVSMCVIAMSSVFVLSL